MRETKCPIGKPRVDIVLVRPTVSIATLCDGRYFWGAWLLAASFARHEVRAPLHIHGRGFSSAQVHALRELPGVSFHAFAGTRHPTLEKPRAFEAQQGEWIGWIDADCIVTGDITDALVPRGGDMMIRLRGEAEESEVWAKDYGADEPEGRVPRHVLERWRGDVASLERPRQEHTCVANAFVVHRSRRDFIERWGHQMERVLDPAATGLLARDNRPYRMTDESVLSSLLAFDAGAPTVAPYALDHASGPKLMHFSLSPKPWVRWSQRSRSGYDEVMDTIRWAFDLGIPMLALPHSLDPRYARQHQVVVQLDAHYRRARSMCRSAAGQVRRRLRKVAAALS
jgi:hypothetical protein